MIASGFVFEDIYRSLDASDINAAGEKFLKYGRRYQKDRDLILLSEGFADFVETRNTEVLNSLKSRLVELQRTRKLGDSTHIFHKDARKFTPAKHKKFEDY